MVAWILNVANLRPVPHHGKIKECQGKRSRCYQHQGDYLEGDRVCYQYSDTNACHKPESLNNNNNSDINHYMIENQGDSINTDGIDDEENDIYERENDILKLYKSGDDWGWSKIYTWWCYRCQIL